MSAGNHTPSDSTRTRRTTRRFHRCRCLRAPHTFIRTASPSYTVVSALPGARSMSVAGGSHRRFKSHGVGKDDTVAAMLPNIPAMYDAHFGVPMAGAVLNTLNTRLDAKAIAFMLDHGEAKVLITDREFSGTMQEALRLVQKKPLVIDVDDPAYAGGEMLGVMDYERFIADGDPEFAWWLPQDEWDAITLNYTSGTTGNPKGVVYHHRGAYLNAISNIVSWGMPPHAVYLWTLPMFHCNGWCFPWTMAANAGTNVCLRKVEAKAVFRPDKRARASRTIAAHRSCITRSSMRRPNGKKVLRILCTAWLQAPRRRAR